MIRNLICFGSLVCLLLISFVASASETPLVSFHLEEGKLRVLLAGQPIVTYVYRDPSIPRPYFCDARTPDGLQVTRNHPPIEGTDRTDHATYHPGIWLAFGDISGADSWRNKAAVRHEGFLEDPTGVSGAGYFAVRNAYGSGEKVVCREACRYGFEILSASDLEGVHSSFAGYLLRLDSSFYSESSDFVFGDQEEMGLGLRIATPISVHKGGTIQNSERQINEAQAWGKTAAWCDYSGVMEGRRAGVVLMPHPSNFRPSWFHARDYGLLVANPFGRNAFTGGEKSVVLVRKEERFPLRFGILVYSTDPEDEGVAAAGYGRYLK